MLVGEQPGERRTSPATRSSARPASCSIARSTRPGSIASAVYVTNVVKHFKWEPRGKRRIHKKPNAAEIAACRPWLDTEIALVEPRAIVCLGATAAQALLGRQFKVTAHRGEFIPSPLAPLVLATVHPSSLLRAPDEETRRRETRRFIDDLRKAARALSSMSR